MSLTRFGSAALRLEKVIAIRNALSEDETDNAHPDLEVFFSQCEAVTFRGADADAIRRLIARLPEDPEKPKAIGWSNSLPDSPPVKG